MKKKIKQLRYVQFAEYQPSPYTKRLIEKSEQPSNHTNRNTH